MMMTTTSTKSFAALGRRKKFDGSGGGGGGGSGGGVNNNETVLQRMTCPAIYQKELFMFLYDFFLCRPNNSSMTSVASLFLPSSNGRISKLLEFPVEIATPIPVDELRDYRYEDDRFEDNVELEARLRSFPTCRIIHERLSSYRLMAYERTIRTITVVMEVSIDTMFRQCHLFLLQQQHKDSFSLPSLWLSYQDVGRMFVEAWRDYVLQSRYGREHPSTIVLKSHREVVVDNLVTYYKEYLGIDRIESDDMLFDFYAFESDEIKKGTNLSRLTKSMQQLEVGEHVTPFYISVFNTLYIRMIVEPLVFLKVQNDYESVVVTSAATTAEDGTTAVAAAACRKRGRKRRDPEKIIQSFDEEKQKRDMWYQQQQHLQFAAAAATAAAVSEEEDQMLQDILTVDDRY